MFSAFMPIPRFLCLWQDENVTGVSLYEIVFYKISLSNSGRDVKKKYREVTLSVRAERPPNLLRSNISGALPAAGHEPGEALSAPAYFPKPKPCHAAGPAPSVIEAIPSHQGKESAVRQIDGIVPNRSRLNRP